MKHRDLESRTLKRAESFNFAVTRTTGSFSILLVSCLVLELPGDLSAPLHVPGPSSKPRNAGRVRQQKDEDKTIVTSITASRIEPCSRFVSVSRNDEPNTKPRPY